MRRRSTPRGFAVFGASIVAASVLALPADAQDSRSAALVKELTALLGQKKLDSVAARHPGGADQFVAALFFPGQLLVITARTTAPAVVNEKLIRHEFRDVYIDLNSASILESRHFVTDLGPDGLRVKPEQKSGPSDSHDLGAKSIRFDGNWREDKMSEDDYMKAFSEADAAYARAVQALIDELKKG